MRLVILQGSPALAAHLKTTQAGPPRCRRQESCKHIHEFDPFAIILWIPP